MTAIQIDPNYAEAYGELAWVQILWTTKRERCKIGRKPSDPAGPNAILCDAGDLYSRLMFPAQAEQVLQQGILFATPDDKHLFNMRSLLGSIYELRGDVPRAVTEYEAAKKSCESNKCNDHKEAYFNLGAAYAELKRRTKRSSSCSRFGRSRAKVL